MRTITNHLTLILSIALMTACTSSNSSRIPDSDFSVVIGDNDLDFKKSRELALQYLSRVEWFDYDGKPINITTCDGSENISCDYFVHHWGNGCTWGSYVTESCKSGECSYSFTPYDNQVLCE